MAGEHAKDPLRGASNFLGIMFNKIPFDAEVDTRFLWFSKTIRLKTENYLLFGSHKTCFFSYEQRARKTVLRVAIERDLSLKQIHCNYQTQIDLFVYL